METRNHDITVVTRDENLAVEFVNNVKKWIYLWNMSTKDKNDIVPDSCLKRLSVEIPHKDGVSRLLAVSSNPDAVIGKGGDIILDEFAVHKDPKLLWSLAQPVIMAGGNCTILSTHRSRNTLFNKLVEDAENDPNSEWSVHRTTLEDAVDEGLVELIVNPTLEKLGNPKFETRRAFIEWIKKTVDSHTYDQEYMCNPSDSSTVLLSREELKNAFKRLKELGSIKEGMHYVGWDIAESEVGDFATLCVLNVKDSDVEIAESIYIPKGTSIDDQIDMVKELDRKYHPYRIVCDENGIGRYPTAVLKKKLGQKVIGFTATMNSKAEMYTKVKRFFENGKVRMVEDDAIEQDFLSIERTITSSNNIVYSASRINGSHGDMASAFSMALTEVPENFDPRMVGVTTNKTNRIEVPPSEETIHDRIARNKRLDMKAKKKLTY
jgi:phage FluMu gp28-like protein